MSPHPPSLQTLVSLARQAIPVASGASVTIVTADGASTAAASPGWAAAPDEAQYRAGSGPCVDAAIGGEIRAVPDVASETRWPSFVAAAREAGTGAWLSVPLAVDDGLLASLNLCATSAGAFTDDHTAALRLLGSVAAVALSTSSVPGAHPAFPPRAAIDQAKGILMHGGLSPAEALDELTRRAQASGQRLLAAAQELIRATSQR